jgi:hypothetical protein
MNEISLFIKTLGGILLEFLVMPTNSVGQDHEIFRQLIDLVLPLVNPETRYASHVA